MIWYLTEFYLSKRSKLPVYGFICRACSCQVSAFRQVTTSWKCLSWAAPQSGKMSCLEVCERNRFVRVFVDGPTWKFHVLFDALTGNPSTLLDFLWTLPVHPSVWQVSLTSRVWTSVHRVDWRLIARSRKISMRQDWVLKYLILIFMLPLWNLTCPKIIAAETCQISERSH